MTIRRALRTSARQMLISQFSAVDRPLTLAPSGAVMPTRSRDRRDVACDGAPVDQAEARALGDAQHDVLQNRHAGNEGEFLVDEAHAEFGRPRAATRWQPARRRSRSTPRIAVDQAGEDLDQRRLAGAIGADQPVHFAGHDIERHALQRLRAAEGLGDVSAPRGAEAPIGVPAIAGQAHLLGSTRPYVVSSSTGQRTYWIASGCSARKASTVSLVTSTAGTSTALGCPGRAGVFDLLEHLHHVVAFGEAVLPGRRGHEAVLDVLERLRVAVDAIDLARRRGPGARSEPMAPIAGSSQQPQMARFSAAGRMAGQPGIGVLRAVLEIAGDAHFVLGDLDVGIGFAAPCRARLRGSGRLRRCDRSVRGSSPCRPCS